MRGLAAIACLAAAFATPALACDYPGGPPDAREVRATGEGVTWAYYSNATTIYDHGILGDAIEASVLRAETPLTGPCFSMIYLGDDAVFEDVTPRIADVTGDGLNDVVVIETRLDAGASLAVYGMNGDSFEKLASTPHIGSPHRWLAPAGIADFDGDGDLTWPMSRPPISAVPCGSGRSKAARRARLPRTPAIPTTGSARTSSLGECVTAEMARNWFCQTPTGRRRCWPGTMVA